MTPREALRHQIRLVRRRFTTNRPTATEVARPVLAITAGVAVSTVDGFHLLGAYLALGALWGSIQDAPREMRRRLIRISITAAASAAGCAVGVLSAQEGSPVLRAAVLAVIAFGSGFMSAAGPRWSIAALQVLLGAIVGSGFPLPAQWWQPPAALAAGCLGVLALGFAFEGTGRLHARLRNTPRQRHPAPASEHKTSPLHVRVRFGVLLSGCVLAAVGLEQFTGGQRGFWLPLTVAFIYKPEVGPVLPRALARCVGTVIGAAVAAYALKGDGSLPALVLTAIAAVILAVGIRTSYGLTTAGLTMIVFCLNSALGPIIGLPTIRVRDTLLAAALVVAAEAIIGAEVPLLKRSFDSRRRQRLSRRATTGTDPR